MPALENDAKRMEALLTKLWFEVDSHKNKRGQVCSQNSPYKCKRL